MRIAELSPARLYVQLGIYFSFMAVHENAHCTLQKFEHHAHGVFEPQRSPTRETEL